MTEKPSLSAKEPLFELNLFGTFQLHWQGQPLGGISSPKIQALLAYLAVEPAQPYSREQLATLHLGDAYRSLRRWQEAKAAYDRVLASSPNMPEVYFNIGLMYRAAQAEFPGLDQIQALQRSRENFARYRNLMGPRLTRDDPSEQYLSELDRLISRAQRAAEEAAREAERAANPPPAEAEEAPAEEEEWL